MSSQRLTKSVMTGPAMAAPLGGSRRFVGCAAIYRASRDIVRPVSTPLLADLLRTAAAEEPEREAYVHEDRRATYGWLDRVADGFAATLLAHGVGPRRPGVPHGPRPRSSSRPATSARPGSAPITSAVNLRLGPAEQASIVARTEPAVTVVGDGATVPDGVDPAS